mgnify:FL=1
MSYIETHVEAHAAEPFLSAPPLQNQPSHAVSGRMPLAAGASLGEVISAYAARYLSDLGEALEDSDDIYERFLNEMERPLLLQVLAATGNNQVKAAKVLGINRNTLRKKLTMLGIVMRS